MERIPKAVYTPEFRAEAVKLVEVARIELASGSTRQSGLHA